MQRPLRSPATAFDLLALDGVDVRNDPLVERKRQLRRLVAPHCRWLLYLSHVEGAGVDLFRLACEQDLEGIVAKPAHGIYGVDGTWLKVKNREYSQAEGRHEFFNGSRAARAAAV